MITNFKAENFLSHRNTEVKLSYFNVFVGASNSGKTSLLKAMFESSLIGRNGPGFPFSIGPSSFRSKLHRGAQNNQIGFTIVHQAHTDPAVSSHYSMRIGEASGSTSDPSFYEEKLVVNGDLVYDRDVSANTQEGQSYFSSRGPNDVPSGVVPLGRSLRRVFMYRFLTNELKQANPFQLEGQGWIDYQGKGLASSLHNLGTSDPGLFRRIEGIIRDAFPQFAYFKTNLASGQAVGWNAGWQDGSYTPAPLLSDGFVQFVGLVTSLELIKAQGEKSGADSTVILEEPDLSLDARSMKGLITYLRDWCGEQKEYGNQVLFTTHNPYFLRCAWQASGPEFGEHCHYFNLDDKRVSQVRTIAQVREHNQFDLAQPSIGICAELLDGSTVND